MPAWPSQSCIMTEPHFLTVAQAARLIKRRELSPVDLTRAYLGRIEALDPQLNAFITVTSELALRRARKAEREIANGDYLGPLHGIPFGLKDIYTHEGNSHQRQLARVLRQYPGRGCGRRRASLRRWVRCFSASSPPTSLRTEARRSIFRGHLREILGISNISQAARVPARAPRSRPGSRRLHLGSDTGGSIRGPASFCGIAGLMPTFGLVSRAGVIPNSYTFDHCGPMAWTVEDCAIVLQAIAGYDPADAGSLQVGIPNYRSALKGGIKGLKIGVLRHYWEEDQPAHDDLRRAMDDALAVFKSLGAKVADCRTHPLMSSFDVKIIIGESEIFSRPSSGSRRAPWRFRPGFPRPNSTGLFVSGRRLRRRIPRTPAYRARKPAPVRRVRRPRHCRIRSSAATRRLSNAQFLAEVQCFRAVQCDGGSRAELCNGFSATGLPLGMQVIGRPFDETTVLRAGHAYEQASSWRGKRPQLVPGAEQPKVIAQGNEPKAGDVDTKTRGRALDMAARAGLKLDERSQAILLEAAPYAFAMADRIRRTRSRFDEPALVFRFPN